MNPVPEERPASDDTAFMRATTRGDMLRANTAMAVVFVALLALLLAACVLAFRATKNLRRAEAAEARGKERLANAYLEQARAMRAAAEPGRRLAALTAISNAAAISHPMELRTEAAACLALSELAQEGNLIPTPGVIDWTMDMNLDRFAFADAKGTITFLSSNGDKQFSLETGRTIGGMMMSPDGHYLAVRFADRSATVWDLESRRPLDGLPLAVDFISGFSHDSRRLIFSDASNKDAITIHDLSTSQDSKSGVKVGIHFFRVSSDLKRAAICNGLTVDLFDLESGTNITSLTHAARALMLGWSGDGRKLAVSCEDGDIYLWDLETYKHRILTGHSERSVSMGFSPNNTMLYTSSLDGSTRLWNLALGQTIAVGEGIAHGFTADEQRMGFWRPWSGMGTWRISQSSVYSALPCDASEGPLFAIDLSPSGRWCTGTQNTGFRVWDLSGDGKGTYVRATNVYFAGVSPDEQSLLVCSTNGLAKWPLALDSNGNLNLQATNAKSIPLPDGLGTRAVSVSSNGECAAVELTDHRIAVLDLAGKKAPVFLKRHGRQVNYKGPGTATGNGRFAISPDGRWVATGFSFDVDDIPEIWDATTGELALKLDAHSSMVGFSADGRWLGLAGTDHCSLWSAGTWRKEVEMARDGPSITHGAMAIAPTAGIMAVARNRKVAQLRDIGANVALADLISPVPQSVNAIHISHDGTVLVTATASDMLEVWHLDRLRQQLAAMELDWDVGAGAIAQTALPRRSMTLTLTWSAVLAVFALAAGFMLVTLRRHRLAIQRFVVAEAAAAQTSRKLDMAKVELMHSQKMQALGTLATGIAHDFNNLLSVIRMSNTLLGRRIGTDQEMREHVTDIEQAVLQGKDVVGSMLGYARDNGGNGGPVDVNSVVENVVSLLSKEFLGGITLVLELERNLPNVALGRGVLEQILLNLVVNASEAMQGEGKLKIMARARSTVPENDYVLSPRLAREYAEVSVIDSGPGMTPEVKEHIFEPFFTTKRGGTRVGTGLGLALVYSMLQQAEAGLVVWSKPGQGAAFTLLFPAEITAPVRQMHSSQTEKA